MLNGGLGMFHNAAVDPKLQLALARRLAISLTLARHLAVGLADITCRHVPLFHKAVDFIMTWLIAIQAVHLILISRPQGWYL